MLTTILINNPIAFIDLDGLEPATPKQLKTTATFVVTNKPTLLFKFNRNNYELLARRAYYGENTLNQNDQNSLQGAVGEVLFSQRALQVFFLSLEQTFQNIIKIKVISPS